MARILVVDDDESVAAAIDRTLENRGYETIVVHSGAEAIVAAKERHPDLVILDVVMPGMDGIQVCTKLREDEETRRLPIIFLTARAMLEDKVEGFEAGADDYLTKPFAIQELGLRVKALLRRVQTQAQLEADPLLAGARDPDVVVAGRLTLNRRTYEVTTPEQTVLLTPIEFELLAHLMENVGDIFSSDRLLQEVWEYPPGTGDPALVRMHVRNLRSKIEPEGAAQPVFIRTVSRRGYTLRSD